MHLVVVVDGQQYKDMKSKHTPKVILHGEAMIFKSKIPTTAKKIDSTNDAYNIIADSETTGNHHVIDNVPGVTFFKDNDTMYMTNTSDTNVRCVMPNRHDAIKIGPGDWEFGIQQEYNHLEKQLQNVAD